MPRSRPGLPAAAILAAGLRRPEPQPRPEPIRCARCGAAGRLTADRWDAAAGTWRTISFDCCRDLDPDNGATDA